MNSFHKLLLKTYKVDCRTVSILTACLTCPVSAEHMLSCNHDIQVTCSGLGHSLINLCLRHTLRIPSLIHEYKISLRCNHSETFEDGDAVLRFLRRGPVSEDIVVVGIDTCDKHSFVFLLIQRKKSIILKKDNSLTGSFQSCISMFFTKAYIHGCLRIRIRLLKKSKTELDVKNPSYGLINP